MKKLYILLVVIGLTFFSNFTIAQTTSSELLAISVVKKYFEALQRGDVNTIKNILTGNLRTQTENYLSQPEYSNQLVNKYYESSLDIIYTKSVDKNTVIVKATIQVDTDEQLRLIFKLEKTEPSGALQISSETDW